MVSSTKKQKQKQKQNRREYHRLRYRNLSKEEKSRRIHQIRSSLEKKIDSLNPEQLAQYNQIKREKDSRYYYNAKVKESMKELEGLHITTASTKRGQAFGRQQSLVCVPNYVSRVLRSFGGNLLPGGSSGVFGEITDGSLHKVCNELLKHSLVKPRKTVTLDCGAGFGRPSFHFGSYFQSLSIGIEIDTNLFLISMKNLAKVARTCFQDGSPIPPVAFVSNNIMNIRSFNGIDVVYSFDCLFPPPLLSHMGMLFNNSTTARTLVSFVNLTRLEDAGFESLILKSKVSVRMRGSGEGKTAYIYIKKEVQPQQGQSQGCLSLSHDIDKVDPLFRNHIKSYRSGNLDERNLAIDVKSFCSPRKLRAGDGERGSQDSFMCPGGSVGSV